MSCFLRYRAVAFLTGLLLTGVMPVRAEIVRASVSATGEQGRGPSVDYAHYPSLSADGRYVAFETNIPNLVPGDTNGFYDVFVKDLQTGNIVRASMASNGEQGDESSAFPSLSADGRYVAFESRAKNLVPSDTDDWDDIFVRDLQSGTIRRASITATGEQAETVSGGSAFPSLSADGRYVAFSSVSPLAPGAVLSQEEVYVKDLLTEGIVRASLTSTGGAANGGSKYPSLSADGRYVAFESGASNLVPDDTNGVSDVFVRDLTTGVVRRASVSSTGQQGQGFTGWSGFPSLSGDGRYVAFNSNATLLVPDDTDSNQDVYVKDLQTGAIRRVSVPASGAPVSGFHNSDYPAMSGDGRYVTFYSNAELIPGAPSFLSQIYLKDLQTGALRCLSVSSSGAMGNDHSSFSFLSVDGRFAAFLSFANNLVEGDTNNFPDVFVVETGPQTLIGDVNGDSRVNIEDVVLILQFVVQIKSPTDPQRSAADANKSSSVTVDDAVLILRHIVFGIPL